MDIHKIWIEERKPHLGPTNTKRLLIKAGYKKALKDTQRVLSLHSSMATIDMDRFWNSWRTLYSKNRNHVPPGVDGSSSKDAIAESFRQSSEANARPNNKEKVKELDEEFSIAYTYTFFIL